MTANPPDIVRPLRKFFRTPKGLLIALFAFTGTLAVLSEGTDLALPGLLVAMLAAAVADIGFTAYRTRSIEFPSGALLTGAIIGFVLSPFEALPIVAATSVIAIASKQVVRTRLANVFNPAALGLVVSAVLFGTVDSWWGALPELGVAGTAVLIATGVFIADRINKLPLVLTFLGVYFALFTVVALTGDSANHSEIYRAPVLQAALFFAFFMADDPPTAPVKYREQFIFGAIVAVASVLFFEAFHWLYYLPAALLVGNAYEGVRKVMRQRSRNANKRAGTGQRQAVAR